MILASLMLSWWQGSRLSRLQNFLGRAWQNSFLAHFLNARPFWIGSTFAFPARLGQLLPPSWRARWEEGAPLFPWLSGSRLLQWSEPRAYCLLIVLSAYPIIDYYIRYGQPVGSIAGGWKEVALLLGLALVAAKLTLRGKDAYRPNPIGFPLLVFFTLYIFLFLVRSPNLGIAFDGVRIYLEYALWFWVGFYLLENQRQVKLFSLSLLLCTTALACHGIWQYFNHVPIPPEWIDQAERSDILTRAFSLVKSPNILGSLLSLVLPLGVAGLLTAKHRYVHLGYLAATAALALALIFTFSRGAWFSAVLGLSILGFLAYPPLIWALIAAAIATPLAIPSVADRLLYLFSYSYYISSQRGGRIIRWQAALEKVSHHPLVGEGWGRFGGAVAARAIPGSFYVDNFYLKTAAEGGLIGLGTLVWLIIVSWRAAYQVTMRLQGEFRIWAAAYLGGLSAVLLHNCVENVFETPLMSTFFWLLLGVLLSFPFVVGEEAPHQPRV
ncbi:O-antigen ligase family protein [Desulfothermobacter acidiphilus]|uniref:O-antigen ligase family protein n=1 Tax=Desulfothermobacter acidiphilus TaxID=1938353 RepID=UPI003F894F7A